MNWGQSYCTNQACTAESWMILRDPTAFEVWWVAAHEDDRPFIVAATEPVCPQCGTTLRLSAKLAHHIDDNILGAGKVLEFAKESHSG